jgi:multidrug resistance efflux pump
MALTLGALLAAWGAASGPADVEWRAVRRAPLVVDVEVTGTLEALQSSFLGPPAVPRQWDFKIELMAPEGETVQAGQPVLGFDSSDLRRRLQEAQAAHQKAVKELEKREIDFQLERNAATLELAEAEGRLRLAGLKVDVPTELVSSRDLEQARLDREGAEREVVYQGERLAALAARERAELPALRQQRDREAGRVAELEQAIAQMTVMAPRAGPVIYVSTGDGQKKKIGDSAWRGESVLQIPDLSQLQAQGEVDEAEAGRVTPGQRVGLALDAFPDDELTGRIVKVKSTVRRRSPRDPAKVVGVEILLDSVDPARARPGMRFRGRVEVERSAPVLLVPAPAVFVTAGQPVVWRRRLMGPERVEIALGRRGAGDYEVTGGLVEGDEVSLVDLGEAP